MTDKFKARVIRIVHELIGTKEYYEQIDENEIIKLIYDFTEKVSFSELDTIDDNELKSRIEKTMMLEVFSGILSDITPEQEKAFDESVKRRR